MSRPDPSARREEAGRRPVQPVRRREDSTASALLRAPWQQEQPGREAHASLSASIHETFGNTLMLDALSGRGGGPAPILEAAMTLGAAGVSMPESTDALLSNSFVSDWIARSAETEEQGPEVFEDAAERKVRAAKRRGGQPLPDGLRARFEAAFGDADFSRVRVHTDGAAASATRSVNALAYTMGEEIWFAPGRFDPSSAQGQHLLAHELTHVVQHQEGRLKPAASQGGQAGDVQVSSPFDGVEREAESNAAQVTHALGAQDMALDAPDLAVDAPIADTPAASAVEGDELFRSARAPNSQASVAGEDEQAASLSRVDLYAVPEGEYAEHEAKVSGVKGQLKALLSDSDRWDSLEESERGKALRDAVGGILDSLDLALKVVLDLASTTLDVQYGALVASLGASIGILEWLATQALREDDQVEAPELSMPSVDSEATELGMEKDGPDPAMLVEAALNSVPTGGSAFTRAARQAMGSALGMLDSVNVLFQRIREQEPEAKAKADPNNDRSEEQLRKEDKAEQDHSVSDQLKQLEARLAAIRGGISSGPDLSTAGGANVTGQEEEVDQDKLSNLKPAVLITDTALRRRPKDDDPQSFIVNLVQGVRVGFQTPTRGWVQVVVLEGRDEGRAGYIHRDAIKLLGDTGDQTLNRSAAGPIDRWAQPAQKPKGGGQALPGHLVEQYLPVLGPAIKHLRIHVDQAAGEFAQSVQAVAVTDQQDVYFSPGAFRPGTKQGDELIAEEVFHGVKGGGRGISQPGDAHEKEAGRFAEAFAGGPGRAIAQMTAGMVNNQIIERLATRLGLASPTPRRENPTARKAGPGGRGPGSQGPGGKRIRRRRTTLDDIAQELLAGISPDGEMATRQGDGLNRQAEPEAATTAAPAEDEEREPTAEELAALNAGVGAVATGEAQSTAAGAQEVGETELSEEEEEVEQEEEGAEQQEGAQGAEGDSGTAGGPSEDDSSAGLGSAPDGSCNLRPAVSEVLSAGGPERNTAVAASDALLETAWGFDSTAVQSLSAFTNGAMDQGGGGQEGSLSPVQVLGQGNAVQNFLGTAQRGDGALATTIEVCDAVRAAATKIASITGTVGMISGLLSLIGLFPPAAPIGAALASFSSLMSTVGTVSTAVAAGMGIVVSVLSAIQLVAAVKDGAPEALDLYTTYRQDVGNMVNAGLSYGFNKLWSKILPKGVANNKGQLKAGHQAMTNAAKATDGRSARGLLFGGLRDSASSSFKPNLLSTAGSSVANLRRSLGTTVALSQGGEFLLWGTKKVVKGQVTGAGKAANEDGTNATAAFQVNAPTPAPPLSIGAVHWPVAPAPQGPANRPNKPITPPNHNPGELDQIIARIHEIDQAIGHVRTERNEAQAALAAAAELEGLATERTALADDLDAQAAEHQAGFVQMQADAAEGQAQAAQGLEQAAQQQQAAGETQENANSANAALDGQSVPPPEPQGFFGRVKAWFQEKIVNQIKKGLQWVQDKIAAAVLAVVSKLMGVDDIHAELDAIRADMGVASSAAEGAQQLADEVKAQAATARQQASEAQSAASAASSQAQAEVSQATSLENQLVATKVGLADEMRTVREEMIQFDRDAGEQLEGSPEGEDTSVDPGVLGACNGLVDYTKTMLDTQEGELSAALTQGQSTVTSAAEAGGLGGGPGSAVMASRAEFKAAQDRRRASLADVRSDLGNLSALGQGDAQAALAQLGAIVAQVQESADGDADAVHEALSEILSAAAQVPAAPSGPTPPGPPGGLRTDGPRPGARSGRGGPPGGGRPGGAGGRGGRGGRGGGGGRGGRGGGRGRP